jgi:hypothetical protein
MFWTNGTEMKGIISILVLLLLLATGCTPSSSVPGPATTEPESPLSTPSASVPPSEPMPSSTPQPKASPEDTAPPRPAIPSVPTQRTPRPSLELDRPLPTGPAGEIRTFNLGAVTLETYTPVTITSLEHSTNFYVYARNTGDTATTVAGPLANTITAPGWVQHFYELNPYPQEILPGETAIFEFMVAEGGGEGGSGTISLPFNIAETGQSTAVTLQLACEAVSGAPSSLPMTAAIGGRVSAADGNPLAGVTISVYTFNAREEWRTETDNNGDYYVQVPSTDDIAAAMGERPLPYRSLGFNVIAAPDGHRPGFRGEIEVARGETKHLDFTLEPVATRNYTLKGEYTSDGLHGYWWVLPAPGFESVVAVQGRHPPELPEPGHIVKVDVSGKELWRYPTSSECWGLDVSKRGDVAAGSHDGKVYMLDAEGDLRWKLEPGQMNRWIRFSPDGSTLVTGPVNEGDIALLDADTGRTLWASPERFDWLRNAAWSPDGECVIAGFAGGKIAMFTRDGELLWKQAIGEFPMVLEIDANHNTYMAGKNRELFSFDADGNLRWRYRIGNHVVTAGWNNMSSDGDLIVLGTVGGWVQAYSARGELLWQRHLPGTLQGHNALDMTPDGQFIVVGSAGEPSQAGYITLFDRYGTVLWETQSSDRRDNGTISFPYEYDHNHRGAITVAISDDGGSIAAGYGDSTIRIFQLVP